MRIQSIAVLCFALGLSLGLALGSTGCTFENPFVRKAPGPNPNAPKVTRVPVVKTTGRKAAVLSVHLRKEFPDACMFGVTLTNNLDVKVTNLSVRLSAYLRDGVLYEAITRNFYEVRPTESQYRDLVFTSIRCREIEYIGVSDPGRCAIGEANRFTTAQGDCAKYIDVADSRLISLRVEQAPKRPETDAETGAETGAGTTLPGPAVSPL